ncbi:unnamed protein product, partial [Rotaria magnacalcarata]
MDPLDFQLTKQYNEEKKKERYSSHNAARRKSRLEAKRQCYSQSITTTQDIAFVNKQHVDSIIDNAYLENHHHEHVNDHDNYFIQFDTNELIEFDEDDDYNIRSVLNYAYDDTDPVEETHSDAEDSVTLDIVPLHNYTITSTYDYCEAFTAIARQANLSRQSTNDFLSLLKSGLPVPNNLPSTEEQLLLLLGVDELFTKRSICLLCFKEFNYMNKICSRGCSTDKKSIGYIYDGNVLLMIQKIMIRLSSVIREYKKKIHNSDHSENINDIPFGTTYQNLLKKNAGHDLISLLLHIDGISITNSTKLKLWLLSGSIIEAPPKLRSCRRNMIVISIWLAYIEPPAHLWLNHCVNNLKRLKEKGIDVLNNNHKLIIFGITGDCPALSLITNFINHNGYFSCWFCFIQGKHVNKKRQYYYESTNLRTPSQYLRFSNEAEITQSNIYGHLGNSIVNDILDVNFPNAIILDYLHVSLLGHGKLIILLIYQQLKPKQRQQLNSEMNNQLFPNFFHRKLRSIDNFGFVKGTEVRNVLFYGLLPHLSSFMHLEQYSHLTLYICALRLLHSGHIFHDETSVIANQLFVEFYKDHELFYQSCQSLKLHLHIHLASLYKTHGSLCNIGCFGQESFIGFISNNHHGTRFYGDSIVHFYNIDFAIQNRKKENKTIDGPFDPIFFYLLKLLMASKFTEVLAKRSKKQKQQYSPSNPTTTTTMYHLIIDNGTNQKMIVGNSSVKRLDNDGTVKLNNGRKAQLIFSGTKDECMQKWNKTPRLSENTNIDEQFEDDDESPDLKEPTLQMPVNTFSTPAPYRRQKPLARRSNSPDSVYSVSSAKRFMSKDQPSHSSKHRHNGSSRLPNQSPIVQVFSEEASSETSSDEDEEIMDASDTTSWKRLFDELKDTQLYIKDIRTDYQGVQQQLTNMTKKLSKFSSMMLSRNEPDFGKYRDPNVTQN